MKTQHIGDAIREQWAKACEHDGIPPDSHFVVFSDDNPHIKRHRNLVGLYQAGQRLIKASG